MCRNVLQSGYPFFSFLEKDAKRKWKNLRDYYRQELKKQDTQKSGAGADHDMGTSTWTYFRQMSFLKDILKPDFRSSNLAYDETASVFDEEEGNIEFGNEKQVSEESNGDESVPPSRPRSPSNTPCITSSGPSTSRELNAEPTSIDPSVHQQKE